MLSDDRALLRRTVTPPHGDGVKRSSARAKDSRKDAVIFSQEELRQDPGVYSVTVTSNAHVESDYTLDIQQARVSIGVQLHRDDEAALKKVKACKYSDPEAPNGGSVGKSGIVSPACPIPAFICILRTLQCRPGCARRDVDHLR